MHILPEIAFSFPLPLSQVAHASLTALEKKKTWQEARKKEGKNKL